MVIAWGACALLIGLAGFVFLRGEATSDGPLDRLRAHYSGIVFQVTESDVATLAGMDRFRVTLEPIRGSSNIRADEMLVALCGSILSAKSALADRGFDRDRVFRVEIQVRNDGKGLFEGAIPITVTDGACRPDIRSGQYLLRYPDPIGAYVLDYVEPMDGADDAYELRFNHFSDTPAVLSEFDFQTACAFVAEDRPPLLAEHLEFDGLRKVRIVAQSGWDVGVLTTYRNLFADFNWANGACIPVEAGAPA